MMRALAVLGLCVVLALDWLALDDITTGHQPNFHVEWTFLFISLPLLWVLVRLARKRHGEQRPA